MKVITYNEYNCSKGIIYDLEEPSVYKKSHLRGAINVPFDKLLANYKQLMSKNNKYLLYCNKGLKSRKAVSILEYYGYDVALLKKE